MASLVVRKIMEELVAPCEPTPRATLSLSSIDRALGMALMMEMVSVYPSNNRKQRDHGKSLSSAAAKAIRGALVRALVPYYPVAGRLVSSGGDHVEVACSGEGVWFVEAAVTDHDLSDMSDWEAIPRRVVKEELLPSSPAHLNQQEMILMMQVTHFPCSGFVVGVKFNHLVFDGIGIGLFLKAISEIACGFTHLSLDPIWRRDTIPAPLLLSKSLPVFITTHDINVNTKYDFSIQTIKRLKKEIQIEASNRFTAFEVVAAILWKCRTQAISPIGDVCLIIVANIRHLLWQLPKAGYYGNCIYAVTVTANSERIVKASLAELVGLIRGAKEGLSTKFKEWISGNFTEDPYKVSIDYNNLTLSDWKWLEVYEANYGWGIPHYVSPLNDFNFTCGFLLKQPLPEEGVRFEGQVVIKEHEQRFIDEIERCINV